MASHKTLPKALIKDILANNPKPVETEKPSEETKEPPATVIESKILVERKEGMEYDTLHPVENIRTFVKFLKEVVSRWEGNFAEIGELNKQTVDLLHYIELEPEMDTKKGYEVYRKLREATKRRRTLKDENRLLESLCNYVKANPNILTQLAAQQGYCANQADAIARQAYLPRTDILEELGGEDV